MLETLIYNLIKKESISLTSEAGILSVFLTNTFPHSLFNIIKIHSTNCIKDLIIDYIKQYIFTGTNKGDGDISILNLIYQEKKN